MQRLRLLAIVTVPFIAVAAIAVFSPRTLWTAIDGGDVASSLQRTSDWAFIELCTRMGPGRWSCRFEADPGSGTTGSYRATVADDGCWTATTETGYTRLHGCINVIDYVLSR
jgi:hypothetical protein